MRTRLLLLLAACSSPADHTPDAAPDTVGCGAPTGEFHSQKLVLGDGIEDRYYWLHVPASYDCAKPMPLLVDFHGTATDTPEEAYQTPALIAFSDAHGVIVARPRSRSSMEGGFTIYRWDQNADDIPRNVKYAKNLVADLEHRYAIDATRVYASGFSSGSNMSAQFLLDPQSPFHGLGPIAGGIWSSPALPPQGAGPRVYMSTGYRDYLWPDAQALIAALGQAQLPADHLCMRHTGGGHDLYGWHFDELFQFLDTGTCPGGGTAMAPWSVQTLPMPADVNAFARFGTTLVAAGAQGRTWKLGTSTGWAVDLARNDADYTALCLGSTGRAFVGGDYRAAFGTSITWSAGAGFPDYGMLGAGWANSATCRDDGTIVVVGYWSAASNNGTSWSQFHEPTMFAGVEAQLAGVATAPGGATVAAGYYDYIGRAALGQTTAAPASHPGHAEWWNGVAAVTGGKFWVVGDGGAILHSTDDGVSWSTQVSHTTENLYAVSFADELHGAAVGRRGTVVVTSDGGTTWTPRGLGVDIYLGAVNVDATTVWIGGEGGLVASSPR